MAVDQEKLHASTDAQVWAQEFMAEFGDRKDDIDEALMIGWFANAIETAKTERDSKAAKLAVALVHTQEYIGSDRLPPVDGWSWFDALSDYYGEPFVPADRKPRREPDPDEVAVTNG